MRDWVGSALSDQGRYSTVEDSDAAAYKYQWTQLRRGTQSAVHRVDRVSECLVMSVGMMDGYEPPVGPGSLSAGFCPSLLKALPHFLPVNTNDCV